MQPIAITPGEPAGIGPDIVLDIAQNWQGTPLVIIADPTLMQERAAELELNCDWPLFTGQVEAPVSILAVPRSVPTVAGQPDTANVAYVLNCLQKATTGCLNGAFSTLITGPVHKEIINQSGLNFSGHTDFLADLTGTDCTVMTFLTDFCPVGLITTHLPLRAVADAITKERVMASIRTLASGLQRFFGIEKPHIAICGLNPHAGEGGYLGREEIDTIIPVVARLKAEGYHLTGPLSADSVFAPQNREGYDAILSPYHDQALPAVKALGFGGGVQVSLGLPFLRISVDHGTALQLAGTGRANSSSLRKAIDYAEQLSHRSLIT